MASYIMPMVDNKVLLGHFLRLQFLDREMAPLHGFPPCCGGVHVRVLSRVPRGEGEVVVVVKMLANYILDFMAEVCYRPG